MRLDLREKRGITSANRLLLVIAFVFLGLAAK